MQERAVRGVDYGYENQKESGFRKVAASDNE